MLILRFSACAAAVAIIHLPALAASFEALGDLPGGEDFSAALGVSSDGTTIVGMSKSALTGARTEAFVWTRARGLESLGELAGGGVMSAAGAVSADGSVIAGLSESSRGTEAFRWTRAGGMVGLGDFAGGQFNSGARGISDDGTTIVGSGNLNAGFAAFRWTASEGLRIIGAGDLSGGSFSGSAQTASSNGSIIYGSGTTASGPATFRWSASTGMVNIGELPGGGTFSEPFGASPDGRFCVGRSQSSASGGGFEAFRYDAVTQQLIGLGDLAGGAFSSMAEDVSSDGSLIVGSATTARGEEAFLWDNAHGMRLLADVLASDYNIHLDGWILTSANGISADGRVIVGGGINPDGHTEAWMVVIPTPATSMLLLGAAITARRERRR